MSKEMHYRKEEGKNGLVGYTLVDTNTKTTDEEKQKKNLPDNVQIEATNNSSNLSIENDKDFKKDSTETKAPKFVSVWITNNTLEFLPEEEEEDSETELMGYYHDKDYRDGSISSVNSTASESSVEELEDSDDQYTPTSSADESTSEGSDD